MYAVIRNYQNEAPDILDQIRTLRMPSKMSSEVSKVSRPTTCSTRGTVVFATISVFEDRAGAEESTRAAAKWVAENIADWTPNPPTIIQGDVAISLAR